MDVIIVVSGMNYTLDCTYRILSPKHLHCCVTGFAGHYNSRYNIRERGAVSQMQQIAASMIGKRLTYDDLIVEDA